MNLSETQIARPAAYASIEGVGNVSPDSIHYTCSLTHGKIPTVRIAFHDKGGTNESRSPASEDMSAKLGAMQNAMHASTSPRCTVDLEDGIGGTLSFEGYLTAPMYEISMGSIGQSAVVVHRSAVLHELDFNPYGHGALHYRGLSDVPEGGSKFSSWMLSVWQHVEEEWKKAMQREDMDPETKKNLQTIHSANTNGLREWEAVLGNSEDDLPELGQLSSNPLLKEGLASCIRDGYLNSSGGFGNTINKFEIDFGILYVPAHGTGYGKFILASAPYEDEETEDVHVAVMQLSAGSRNITPVTKAVVSAFPSPYYRSPDANQTGEPPRLAQYPPDVDHGRHIPAPSPIWLSTDITYVPEKGEGGDPPDLDRADSKKKEEDDEVRKMLAGPVKGILDKWAKEIYIRDALSPATATLMVPLDLTWEVGKCYKIRATGPDGENPRPLFTGFLISVDHSMSSMQTSMSAHTKLTFSYVRGEGFELPGA